MASAQRGEGERGDDVARRSWGVLRSVSESLLTVAPIVVADRVQ